VLEADYLDSPKMTMLSSSHLSGNRTLPDMYLRSAGRAEGTPRVGLSWDGGGVYEYRVRSTTASYILVDCHK
jgi:hypothetical protein